MMNFNDIKAFIDFASDPQKYKDVIDTLDARQKQWEALVEQHCALEAVDRNLMVSEKKLASLTEDLGKKQAEFDAKIETRLAEAATLKQEAKLELEQAKQAKQEAKEQNDLATKASKEAKKLNLEAAELKQQHTDALAVVQEIKLEYEAKLEKINSILK